ncbi:MAG: hypothetical protein R2851_22020 [Caldilineaceae bacterium]
MVLVGPGARDRACQPGQHLDGAADWRRLWFLVAWAVATAAVDVEQDIAAAESEISPE